jgi:hypothetical protein
LPLASATAGPPPTPPPRSPPTKSNLQPNTGPESTQEDVFQHCEPLIDGVLKGLNGTIMGGF